jgi:hypothetical protein
LPWFDRGQALRLAINGCMVELATAGGASLNSIRKYLTDSSNLTESDRAKLLKLVWLLGQVSDSVRDDALREIRPYMADETLDRTEFMNNVERISEQLERQRTPTS